MPNPCLFLVFYLPDWHMPFETIRIRIRICISTNNSQHIKLLVNKCSELLYKTVRSTRIVHSLIVGNNAWQCGWGTEDRV